MRGGWGPINSQGNLSHSGAPCPMAPHPTPPHPIQRTPAQQIAPVALIAKDGQLTSEMIAVFGPHASDAVQLGGIFLSMWRARTVHRRPAAAAVVKRPAGAATAAGGVPADGPEPAAAEMAVRPAAKRARTRLRRPAAAPARAAPAPPPAAGIPQGPPEHGGESEVEEVEVPEEAGPSPRFSAAVAYLGSPSIRLRLQRPAHWLCYPFPSLCCCPCLSCPAPLRRPWSLCPPLPPAPCLRPACQCCSAALPGNAQLPCLAMPCCALPRLAVAGAALAMPCLALPCLAVPCAVLSCPASPAMSIWL